MTAPQFLYRSVRARAFECVIHQKPGKPKLFATGHHLARDRRDGDAAGRGEQWDAAEGRNDKQRRHHQNRKERPCAERVYGLSHADGFLIGKLFKAVNDLVDAASVCGLGHLSSSFERDIVANVQTRAPFRAERN